MSFPFLLRNASAGQPPSCYNRLNVNYGSFFIVVWSLVTGHLYMWARKLFSFFIFQWFRFSPESKIRKKSGFFPIQLRRRHQDAKKWLHSISFTGRCCGAHNGSRWHIWAACLCTHHMPYARGALYTPRKLPRQLWTTEKKTLYKQKKQKKL